MSMNNLQQSRLNRQEIIYYPFKGMYDPVKFAEWLESAFQDSTFKSYAQLGEAAGLSRSAVSAFAKAKPQTANNKASQPKAENVVALAKALNKDIDEALLAAGHAPTKSTVTQKPQNVYEFYERLNEMGLGIKFEGGSKSLVGLDEDDLQDLLDQIQMVTQIKINKKSKAKS